MRVGSKEVSNLEFSDRKDFHPQDNKSDHEHGRILESKIVTTQEIPGEESLRMSNLIVTGAEVGSFEGIVTQRVPRVSVSLLPEKLSREVSQKENTGQQEATISPIPDTSEEERLPPVSCPTMKMDEKTPQEKLRASPGSEQTPLMTVPGGASVNPEPFRATKVSYPVVYLCVCMYLLWLISC